MMHVDLSVPAIKCAEHRLLTVTWKHQIKKKFEITFSAVFPSVVTSNAWKTSVAGTGASLCAALASVSPLQTMTWLFSYHPSFQRWLTEVKPIVTSEREKKKGKIEFLKFNFQIKEWCVFVLRCCFSTGTSTLKCNKLHLGYIQQLLNDCTGEMRDNLTLCKISSCKKLWKTFDRLPAPQYVFICVYIFHYFREMIVYKLLSNFQKK